MDHRFNGEKRDSNGLWKFNVTYMPGIRNKQTTITVSNTFLKTVVYSVSQIVKD